MKAFKTARDIKVGVVGYGAAFNMGPWHLREMHKAGMTPLAVADMDPTRLAKAKEDFPGIETYASMSQMLRKSAVNLVTLITPHNTHAKLAVQCLRAGRHVVCEKPMAITTAECDRMIAAAGKHRRVVSTYHNRHWDGCILEATRQIRRGVIGDVVRVEAHMGGYSQPRSWWRSSKTISGGILYDWGVHLLEYSLQILGGKDHEDRKGREGRKILEVSGYAHRGFWGPKTSWKNDTIEDEGYAVVRLSGGVRLTLCISQIDSHPKGSWVEITGTKGTYTFDHGSWQAITHGRGTTVTTRGSSPPSQSWRFYQNIADHLTGKKKLVITPQWARRPIHILDLACRSAAKGTALKARYH